MANQKTLSQLGTHYFLTVQCPLLIIIRGLGFDSFFYEVGPGYKPSLVIYDVLFAPFIKRDRQDFTCEYRNLFYSLNCLFEILVSCYPEHVNLAPSTLFKHSFNPLGPELLFEMMFLLHSHGAPVNQN